MDGCLHRSFCGHCTQANGGDEIWIVQGTYVPNDVNVGFNLKDGLKIYGGFDGTETATDQRDPNGNVTILSGDVNGDDLPGEFVTGRADNARHIMWADTLVTNATVIDGFLFTGGTTVDVSGAGDDRRGGAILAYGSLTIRNCQFIENYGWFGGAIYPQIWPIQRFCH